MKRWITSCVLASKRENTGRSRRWFREWRKTKIGKVFGTANREWLDRSSVKTRARAILDPIPLQCRRLQKIARKVHCSLRRGTGGGKRGRKDKGKDKRQRLVLEAAINRGSKQGEIRRDSPGRFCPARRSSVYEQISAHDTNLRYGDVRTEITRRGTKCRAEKRSTQAREQRYVA